MGPRKHGYILQQIELFFLKKIPNNFHYCGMKEATIEFDAFVNFVNT